jgi:fructose-1,6-bisphosphatase
MHAGQETPMSGRETTLTEVIMQEQRRFPEATGDFTALLNYVRLACKRISFIIGRGALGSPDADGAARQPVDAVAGDVFLRTNEYGGHLAALASEDMEEPYLVPERFQRGRYLLAFHPLDGAANVDVNVPAGSIFSVLRRPEGAEAPDARAFLQPGTQQVCAGYALYGPATLLVLTLGRGVHGFTLDRGFGEFLLTHADLAIPPEASELAVDTSNERFWEPPVERYVRECVAGRSGPRGTDFRLRWITSPVAEVHRVLLRGGLFMCPRAPADAAQPAGLRLVCAANPMAMLVEQAGGAASTGRGRVLDVQPAALHQRVPVILGSRTEVERIERYHREHDAGLDRPFESPLFRERSLFVQSS